MKSMRIVFLAVESLTLVATLVFILLLAHLVSGHVRADLVKSQTADIDAVDAVIKDTVKRAVYCFENSLPLLASEHTQAVFHDFDDIYEVDRRLIVKGIIKKAKDSHIFAGYDLSGSRLAELLYQLPENGTHHTSAFRSAESDRLSFYVAKAQPGGFVVGRISLQGISEALGRLASFRDSVIMIATPDGFVLFSTRPDFPLNVIPEKENGEVSIAGRDYLLTRTASTIFQNDLVILTPLSAVSQIMGSLKNYSLHFVFLMVAISLGKFLVQGRLFFRPLEEFGQMVQNWRLDEAPPSSSGSGLSYREIAMLYERFKERSERILDLIAQLRQNREQLDKMRSYLKNIIDSMPSLLIAADSQGIIKEWNKAAESHTGLSAEEALGRNLWEVMPALKKFEDEYQETLVDMRQKRMGRELLQNGKEVYLDITFFPLLENGGRQIAVRLDDVTAQEKTEQQLRQAQKMETIGNLVGGISHDFNNILTGISGTISLLKHYLETEGEVPRKKLQEYLDIIETAARRAADLIRQLLILARRQETTFAAVDLNTVIDDVVKICAGTFDKRIEIETCRQADKAMVLADAVQMEQVLLNLTVNALHAMTSMRPPDQPAGGRMTISLHSIHADESFCQDHPEAEPGATYWLLAVQDTGVGMDGRTAAKIFDPFYTTKKTGSGLGLTIVENIVRGHRGFMEVQSEPNKGSTFKVFLPALAKAVVGEEKKSETAVPKGKGTILVIDDEETIRAVASDMLELCGYLPLCASDGSEGVSLYEARQSEIDLVILDLNMPGLSGMETMKRLKEINPHVKVLLASGFLRDERVEEGIMEMGAAGFLQKPFTLPGLAAEIAAALKKG